MYERKKSRSPKKSAKKQGARERESANAKARNLRPKKERESASAKSSAKERKSASAKRKKKARAQLCRDDGVWGRGWGGGQLIMSKTSSTSVHTWSENEWRHLHTFITVDTFSLMCIVYSTVWFTGSSGIEQDAAIGVRKSCQKVRKTVWYNSALTSFVSTIISWRCKSLRVRKITHLCTLWQYKI